MDRAERNAALVKSQQQARWNREALRMPAVEEVLLPDGVWHKVAWDQQGYQMYIRQKGGNGIVDMKAGTFLFIDGDECQVTGPIASIHAMKERTDEG